MPKLKTRRGAAKRFKVTASGKFKRRKGFLRHILTHKSRNKKRKLGTAAIVHKADEKALKKLLPYGC